MRKNLLDSKNSVLRILGPLLTILLSNKSGFTTVWRPTHDCAIEFQYLITSYRLNHQTVEKKYAFILKKAGGDEISFKTNFFECIRWLFSNYLEIISNNFEWGYGLIVVFKELIICNDKILLFQVIVLFQNGWTVFIEHWTVTPYSEIGEHWRRKQLEPRM